MFTDENFKGTIFFSLLGQFTYNLNFEKYNPVPERRRLSEIRNRYFIFLVI